MPPWLNLVPVLGQSAGFSFIFAPLMEPKTVLVTGAGGFIGRYLQEEGLRRNHNVYGSYRSPAEELLIQGGTKSFFLEFSEREKLITRLETFAAETGGFEYVIHCAGVTKPEKMEEFHKELQKPEPKKSLLKSFWNGVVTAVPALITNADKVLNIIEKVGNIMPH